MKRSEAIKIRSMIEKAALGLEDADAAAVPLLFPRWKAGAEYCAGDRVCHNGVLYKCITAHISQSDWEPSVATSLFARAFDPMEEYPEWIRPAGAHDAYGMGDKVSHNGIRYVSELDANVYEPGVYGWREAENE